MANETYEEFCSKDFKKIFFLLNKIDGNKCKLILFATLIISFFCAVTFGQTKEKTPVKKTKQTKLEKRFIKPKSVFPGNGYSHGISVSGGRTIYVAGQVAFNEKGELVGKDDIRAQTVQAFENIKAILAESDATFADVVKISYYVKNFNPAYLSAIREVRDSFLLKNQMPPTSTLIGVESLFRADVLIEIECIAVVK